MLNVDFKALLTLLYPAALDFVVHHLSLYLGHIDPMIYFRIYIIASQN